jgi:hypothetical protein
MHVEKINSANLHEANYFVIGAGSAGLIKT